MYSLRVDFFLGSCLDNRVSRLSHLALKIHGVVVWDCRYIVNVRKGSGCSSNRVTAGRFGNYARKHLRSKAYSCAPTLITPPAGSHLWRCLLSPPVLGRWVPGRIHPQWKASGAGPPPRHLTSQLSLAVARVWDMTCLYMAHGYHS